MGLGDLGAVLLEVVQDFAQLVASAGLDLDLGARRHIGVPRDRQQVAAAAQADQIRLQGHLWLHSVAVELHLGDGRLDSSSEVSGFGLQTEKAGFDRIEAIALDHGLALGLLLAKQGGGPFQSAVGPERAVGKIQLVVVEALGVDIARIVDDAVGVDPEKRAQIKE